MHRSLHSELDVIQLNVWKPLKFVMAFVTAKILTLVALMKILIFAWIGSASPANSSVSPQDFAYHMTK